MDLKQHRIWVNHKNKIPHTPNGHPASSTDPKTWSSFEEVKAQSDNIGFVIDPALKIFAIDLDKCLDDEKRMKNPVFALLVDKMDTYTEISPSGTGIHMICVCDYTLLASRSSKCPGIEIYNHGRYFTYTGDVYGKEKGIRTIGKDEMDTILETVGYPWGIVDSTNNPQVTQVEQLLDEKSVVQRMFASKNGSAIESLYNGDTSQYSGDDSAADLALCMHLAFWTRKDHGMMREIWLSSPLGQRKKTQQRKDYQDRTIEKAISSTVEVLKERQERVITKEEIEELDLLVNAKGLPILNAENVRRLAKNDPELATVFRFNEFIMDYETNYHEKGWRPLQKIHFLRAMMYIQSNYPFFRQITRNHIEDGILTLAYELRVNPAKAYFRSLVWDRVERVDTWLSKAYGVEESEYHASVGSNWLKGLAKRVLYPGCKFDYVLVLEGEQGMKKSTSLSVLGSPYHVETVLSPDNKDFFMILARNIIVEFSEGETLARSEMKKLKAVITMLEDEYRVPYDRGITKAPRHCVFAMTTNQDEYLKDETGNRRWLPVRVVREADIEWIRDNREQLLAEACYRVETLNETTWEFHDSVTEEQSKRMVEDPYEDKIAEWYIKLSPSEMENGVTTHDAYYWAYDSSGRELPKALSMTIASMFRNVLKLEKKRTMVEGLQKNRWYPTKESPKSSKKEFKIEEMVNVKW